MQHDYWRVTTYDNYAYHMGNVFEDWMSQIEHNKNNRSEIDSGFKQRKRAKATIVVLKSKIFSKFLASKSVSRIFYRWKKLPKRMIKNYSKIAPIVK